MSIALFLDFELDEDFFLHRGTKILKFAYIHKSIAFAVRFSLFVENMPASLRHKRLPSGSIISHLFTVFVRLCYHTRWKGRDFATRSAQR